jgi:ribosomal protein S18 acetylase RimI-like enzyme
MLFLQDWLVFRLEGRPALPKPGEASGSAFSVTTITDDVIGRLFVGHPALQTVFRAYVSAGALGVAIHDSQQWLAYGWISRRRRGGPPHLPRRIWASVDGWIFSCHTRAEYRGRGLYKRVLSELVSRRCAEGEASPQAIMIDTGKDNTASIRAILASGFRDEGSLRVLVFRAPRVRRPLAAWWPNRTGHSSGAAGKTKVHDR